MKSARFKTEKSWSRLAAVALTLHFTSSFAAPPYEDSDSDGLPDWAEALVSSNTLWGITLSPTNAVSDGVTPDYFRKVGKLYLGEMFTDHDMMEDWWEWCGGLGTAKLATWDARFDLDAAGWSKFARCRAAIWPQNPGVAMPPSLPAPTLRLDVRCDYGAIPYGETRPLVVKVYTDLDMQFPDAVFMRAVSRGMNRLSLSTPSSGRLREGRNRVVAYVADSPGGEYVPGMLFGFASDVDVGWRFARAEIGLSETSAITPRFRLRDGANDRSALFGQGQTTNVALYARIVRVRVVPSAVNGVQTNNAAAVLDRVFDLSARDYIHEGDFLDSGHDIGWNDFQPVNATTNVTYSVEVDGQRADALFVTRRFETTHTPPTAVQLNGDQVCRVAQPTFRWRIDDEDRWASAFGTTYTAFKVKVWNAAGQEVYDSGYQRMPAPDSTGVYSWTAPLYVDCPSPSGNHRVFKNLENYTWRVYTYNSKFKTDDVGSVVQPFRLNVTELDQSSFSTDVKVCYAGPATVLGNRIRVQAFESPDFTGDPVGEAIVTNVTESALDGSVGSPVRIAGLRAGTYYLRAYIDTDYDWALDDWESWGYLNARDVAAVTGTKTIFNPVSVTVGPEIKGEAPRTIFVEDRDTDGDGFPDVWEAEQNGNAFNSTYVQPVTGDAELIAVNTNLTMTLSKEDQGFVAPLVKLLSSRYGVSMLTGLSVSRVATTASGALHVEDEVVDGTVYITSMSVDAGSGKVVLGIGAETAAGSVDPTVAALYSVERGATVTVKVYRTETLAGEWQLVATKALTITSADTEVCAPLPEGIDTKSGFFKVEVE